MKQLSMRIVRGVVVVVSALGVRQAQAVAPTLQYEGRVLASSGDPLEDTHNIAIALYGNAADAAPVWMDQFDIDLEGGRFRVALGSAANPLDAAWFSDGGVWVGVTVDHRGEEPLRVPLGAAPFAAHAATARGVASGPVSATSVAVHGVPVISGAGTWLGPQLNLPGPQGPTGAAGPAGFVGSQGATGAMGGRGPTGGQGPAGAQGPRGRTGAQGAQGFGGAAGSQGGAGPYYGCMFRRSCPSGFRDYGLAGYILANPHYGHCSAVGSAGGTYNSSWTWCHPRLCCAN